MIPHLAVPFRLNADHSAQTVAQDSIDDVTQCVTVLCSTVVGSRLEVPAYGVPDQTFAQAAPSARPVEAAIATWEPRAHSQVTVIAAGAGRQAAINVTVTTS